MDTKKINAMLVAIEKGSLTAAAAELGYTQSGLTHMMNSLEVELGLNLLVRSKNGVHLSPAGQELYPSMRALLDAAAALEREADRLHQRSFSTLRLGAYASVARQWIPSVLAEYRRLSPDTDVIMEVGGNEDIYEKLKNDELDCAIVSYQEALSQGLSFLPLWDDALVAVLPKNDRTGGEAFPVSAFAGREFVMPAFGFDRDIEPLFPQGLGRVAARVTHTNLDDPGIVSMVAHGLGVSILSELIMQYITDEVRVLPLDPPAKRTLGIAVSERRQGDRNIRRFIKCVQSVIGKMYE